MKGSKPLFSTGKDNWQTPKALFEEYDLLYHFTVDAAADETNHLLPKWWGPNSPVGVLDSLQHNWIGEVCWLNPPYSMVGEFIEKAAMELFLHDVTTVCLVPSRTDTKWWHNCVWDKDKWRWRNGVWGNFLKGRVKFVDPTGRLGKHSAPFPSVVLVFSPSYVSP